MLLFQGSSQQASLFVRGMASIVFITWLASVAIQYYWSDSAQKKQDLDETPLTNVSIEQLTLPPLPKPVDQKQMTSAPQSMVAKQSPKPSTTNEQRIENIYQQLSAEGKDVQLAWPKRSGQRQAALDFMYQCVGMQFAVLNENIITPLNQATLSDYSDWIRVAKGSLSSKEKNWLSAFALNGTPIRLFPRSIDLRLASYVAQVLKGESLASLRASYQVTAQRLRLTDIYLNNQPIADSWVLYQGRC